MRFNCIKPNISKKQPKSQNLHKSLKFLFVIAQIFGYFPLTRILHTNFQFKWLSFRLLSCSISILGALSVIIGHVRSMSMFGYDQFQMNGIVFYFSGVMANLIFLKMAQNWHSIMLHWHRIDAILSSYGWPPKLNRNIKLISFVFLLMEASEHFLIQTNKFIVAVHCHHGSIADGLAHFSINMSFPMIFHTIPYHPAVAILFQMINTRMAFAWTFSDLFIILISWVLVQRFRQINARVKDLQNRKVQNLTTWQRIHLEFVQLCQLCHFMDHSMCWLILLSFFTNFYFLIFHVFESLKLRGSPTLEIVYYFISLSLLILRLCSVTIFCGLIHEETQKTLAILNSTTHQLFNSEIARFSDTIMYQYIGFTGNRLFQVRKQLILKIASAVITYELVVIQFSKNSISSTAQQVSRNSFC